jgi:hypothetical protein
MLKINEYELYVTHRFLAHKSYSGQRAQFAHPVCQFHAAVETAPFEASEIDVGECDNGWRVANSILPRSQAGLNQHRTLRCIP